MLEDIKSRIEKLVSLYETEKRKSDGLAAELEALKGELEEAKATISGLREKIDNLKLQSALTGSGDPALAKERITKLVREIDRCIKLLEK